MLEIVRKPMSLIFGILVIIATLISYPLFAANLTPGNGVAPAHIGYVFAPFKWQGNRGEGNFRKNVGPGRGQQYPIIEYLEKPKPNPSPTTATVNVFKKIISINAKHVGVLLVTSHGGCGLLAVESYPKTAAGKTARDNQYDDYINNQGYTTNEIYEGSGTNHYSIGIKPQFLTKYGKLPNSLVYIGACQSSTWTDDFVGINARVAVGNADSPTILQQKNRVTHFFKDMNGRNGIKNRPVSKAIQGLSLSSSGKEATTLAPAISNFSKTGDPTCVKKGDVVTFTYETTSEQIGTPGILTNKSVNVTLGNVRWANNVTLKANVVNITGNPVTFVVDWTKSWSDQNIARLDGNTKPKRNAEGPAHDDYKVKFPECGAALVSLLDFKATTISNVGHNNGYVVIEWKTASEIDNAGFHLWRATNEGWKEGDYSTVTRLTDQLIPAEGNKVEGVSYSYIDTNVEYGVTYYYGLEDIDLFGQSTFHSDLIDSATVE
jgi:hypothetical protein